MTDTLTSAQWAYKIAFRALQILQENGGSMAKSDLQQKLAEQIDGGEFQLPDKFKKRNKDGDLQWQNQLGFYTIDFVKANFLKKEKGVWWLLPESEEWLAKGEQAMIDEAIRRYQEWKKNRQLVDVPVEIQGDSESEPQGEISIRLLEGYDAEAREGLLTHIRAMGERGIEFQEAVAALLRAMGYIVPFVAKKGHADGGVDIIAYRDHLGALTPRLKVQVKHQQQTVGRPELNKLNGVLTGNDIGIFVASSGFSSDAKTFAQTTDRHLELIDINRFIDLWREFYPKMADEDKKRMPLYQILFLAREE